MKTKQGIVHQIASCNKCGLLSEDYVNSSARRAAYRHAKETGHITTVETARFITYNSY